MCKDYTDPAIGNFEPNLDQAILDADVVMALRIQHERFESNLNLDLN